MLSFALLLLAAAPAHGFASADIADAQCFAAFATLPQDTSKPGTSGGTLGAVYFYGKIVGRDPAIDMEGLLRTVAADAKANAAAYLTRCGAEMQTMGDKLTKAGDALTASGL